MDDVHTHVTRTRHADKCVHICRQFTEWRSQWLECRAACQTHLQQAQLESGELLTSFIGRYESSEGHSLAELFKINGFRGWKKFHEAPDGHCLEGSGLNYLINPVKINGIYGWAEFWDGSWSIREEIFPSKDYFEFFVQHCTEGLVSVSVNIW